MSLLLNPASDSFFVRSFVCFCLLILMTGQLTLPRHFNGPQQEEEEVTGRGKEGGGGGGGGIYRSRRPLAAAESPRTLQEAQDTSTTQPAPSLMPLVPRASYSNAPTDLCDLFLCCAVSLSSVGFIFLVCFVFFFFSFLTGSGVRCTLVPLFLCAGLTATLRPGDTESCVRFRLQVVCSLCFLFRFAFFFCFVRSPVHLGSFVSVCQPHGNPQDLVTPGSCEGSVSRSLVVCRCLFSVCQPHANPHTC